MTTTRRELALVVSEITGIQESASAKMVDALFIAMRESLIIGNRIEIRGFGVFQVRNVKAKPSARNPRTGEKIFVPAHRKIHFKPGKLVKRGLHKPLETSKDR